MKTITDKEMQKIQEIAKRQRGKISERKFPPYDPRPEPGPGVCPNCGSGQFERIGEIEYCAVCGR